MRRIQSSPTGLAHLMHWRYEVSYFIQLYIELQNCFMCGLITDLFILPFLLFTGQQMQQLSAICLMPDQSCNLLYNQPASQAVNRHHRARAGIGLSRCLRLLWEQRQQYYFAASKATEPTIYWLAKQPLLNNVTRAPSITTAALKRWCCRTCCDCRSVTVRQCASMQCYCGLYWLLELG
jgi:hypothetical protein